MVALRAEACYKGPGFCAAGSVHDLHKGLRTHQLRLDLGCGGKDMARTLSLYSGPRLLMLEGTVMASPLWPAKGGAAGSRFADMCLRMILIRTFGAYVMVRPFACLSVYVDDLSTQSFGRKEHVQETETDNVTVLVRMLEAPPPAGAGLKSPRTRDTRSPPIRRSRVSFATTSWPTASARAHLQHVLVDPVAGGGLR